VIGAAAIVGTGVVVLLLAPLLPPDLLRRTLWAFEPLRTLSLPVRLVLAALLAATLHPRARQSFVRAVGALTASAVRRRITALVAVPALLVSFGVLRQRNFRLGDGALLQLLMEQRAHLEGHLVTYDEPLELAIHSLAYRGLHAILGWDVAASYALLSSVAGLAFVAVMVRLWHDAHRDDGVATVLATLLSLATPSVQLFFGYVENYTLVALASLVYALLALRSLERDLSPVWPSLALGVAISLHVLAGWLGPSLLYVYVRHARRRPTAGRIALLAAMGAVALAPIAATIAAMTAIGVPIRALGETHLAALKFIFLVDPAAPHFVYPAWSAAHWRDIANQVLLTSLAPLLVLGAVAPSLPRARHRADPRLTFLAIAAAFLHAFAITWNAENGAPNDWDLFALAGFFDAMLAARAVGCVLPDLAARVRLALPAVVLGLALAAGFVWANAVRTLELPARHAAAHLRAGVARLEAGRSQQALADLEEAVRLAPEDAELWLRAGLALWNAGDRTRGAVWLGGYLERAPDGELAPEVRRLLAEEASR
jgi:hypothetical protein